jgi:copper chaperone NosL
MKIFATLLIGFLMITTSLQAMEKCGAGKCGPAMMQGTQTKPQKMKPMFQSVPVDQATLLQEGSAKHFCPLCGMTLPMYYKTNHAAQVDGKMKQYCSLHCLVEDIRKGAKPMHIQVVDVHTLKFVDVDKAHYVVGSSKSGTMSRVSKYAFAHKAQAETFAQANGGEVTDYAGAYASAEKEFDADTARLSQKRERMVEKGKALYGAQCDATNRKFASIAEAKAYIVEHQLCGDLGPREVQAVGLYLYQR